MKKKIFLKEDLIYINIEEINDVDWFNVEGDEITAEEVFEKAIKYGLYDEKRKAIVIRKGEYIVDEDGSWDLEINDLLFPCMEGFWEE